jgi:hypothetical protein
VSEPVLPFFLLPLFLLPSGAGNEEKTLNLFYSRFVDNKVPGERQTKLNPSLQEGVEESRKRP